MACRKFLLLWHIALCIAAVGGNTTPANNHTTTTRACQPPHNTYPFCNTSLSIEDRAKNLISLLLDSEKPSFLTAREGGGGSPGPGPNVSRLGLPEYDWGVNCIHGVQTNCVELNGEIKCPTSFPNPVNYGATFNTSLFRDLGSIIGQELRALWLLGAEEYSSWSGRPHAGLDCWSPNINLNRDPRWGRNQEVPSEDPLVNGLFGTGYTQGIQQGSDPNYIQVVVTLKHWDAYSLEDSDGYTRHNFNAIVSNFTLADSYWPAFKAAVVNGSAKGVMCAYNAVNGIPMCAHPFLNSVLRDLWGFDGYITSDTDAVSDIYAEHHYTATPEEALCKAIVDGGCNINSGSIYHDYMASAVAKGLCTIADIDATLYQSIKLRFELGLFDPIENQPYWHMPASVINSTANQANAMLATLESIILLKNDASTLPLTKGKSVAVLGPHANAQMAMAGNYLGQVCPQDGFDCIVSPGAAIQAIDPAAVVKVVPGCPVTQNDTSGFAAALAAAAASDYVVLMMGIDQTVEGESHDRTEIDLPYVQHEFVAAVMKLNKPTVMVLLNGGMVAIAPEIASVPAIVAAGYPGVFGGTAIARTLYGENTHLGGKLPYTVYPADYINQIKMSDMSMTDAPGRSYRYYTGTPLYPFGYGLSLATFQLSQSSSDQSLATSVTAGPTLTYTVDVTNTGVYTGDEVVFAYMTPQLPTRPGPLRQLIGFERVHLAPGATTSVSFAIGNEALRLTDRASGHVLSTPGTFLLTFTNGADQVLQNKITVTGEEVVAIPFPRM